ncbi:MAG TPA: amidase, partial [Eoetvoesiella sp.]
MTSLTEKSLFEMAGLIRERRVSPVEYTECVLARIKAVDPQLRAFTRVEPEIALKAAAVAEAEIASGQYRGPMHGIPYALKDLIDYARVPTTANSRVLKDNVPNEHAHVTQLLERSGAVFVGKLTTNEFACGGSPIDSLHPAALNPWNPEYITAGSSSGSAVSVAAQLVPLALGTDTNGSIRNPASRCGTVGMKPTYGRVSRRGVFPLAPSQDHVGPLTRTVRDNACALQAIA